MASKQVKVLNKINKESGTYDKLLDAKKNPNDEFYTPREEIEKELIHWASKFEGKNIICPCDWDIFEDESTYSITIEFDEERKMDMSSVTWYRNKIKKITYIKNASKDSISREPSIFAAQLTEQPIPIVVEGEEANNYLQDENRVKCNFLKCLIDLGTQYAIKSITASGFNPDLNKGIKFQDVDYADYDICITNPPFSLYGEFMKYMIDERDIRINTDNPFNFIILAPFLNRVNPNVGLNLMLRKCYLGYNRAVPMAFLNPDKSASLKSKKVAVDWITTYSDAQDKLNNTRIETGIDYNLYKEDYSILTGMTMKDDLSHPIHVKSIQAIPDNYNGWMFGPISILTRLSYDEFEWYLTNAKGYFNKTHKSENPFTHPITNYMMNIQSETNFHGIVFKRKVGD